MSTIEADRVLDRANRVGGLFHTIFSLMLQSRDSRPAVGAKGGLVIHKYVRIERALWTEVTLHTIERAASSGCASMFAMLAFKRKL